MIEPSIGLVKRGARKNHFGMDVYVDGESLNVVQPAKVPARSTQVVTSTKIITSTRLVTGTNGIVSREVETQSVIVTRTIPVTVISTRPVMITATTKSVSGTLAMPASGTYIVVRGDTLIAIARRFGFHYSC
jgi:LysM repeat protein